MPLPLPPGALHVVGAAIVRDDGMCLVAQRPPGGSAGERWEFPGGKVEAGETSTAALVREIAEELDVIISVREFAGRGVVELPARTIALDVYFADLTSGTPVAREHLALRWVDRKELMLLDWAEADIPVLDAVARRLGRDVMG